MTVLCLWVAVCVAGCDLKASTIWKVARSIQVRPDGTAFFDFDRWRRGTDDDDHGGWDVDAKVEWMCWPLCD